MQAHIVWLCLTRRALAGKDLAYKPGLNKASCLQSCYTHSPSP